jgi:hypothetical protein
LTLYYQNQHQKSKVQQDLHKKSPTATVGDLLTSEQCELDRAFNAPPDQFRFQLVCFYLCTDRPFLTAFLVRDEDDSLSNLSNFFLPGYRTSNFVSLIDRFIDSSKGKLIDLVNSFQTNTVASIQSPLLISGNTRSDSKATAES